MPDTSISFTTYPIKNFFFFNALQGSLPRPVNIFSPQFRPYALLSSYYITAPTATSFTSMALIIKYILLTPKDIIYSPDLCHMVK